MLTLYVPMYFHATFQRKLVSLNKVKEKLFVEKSKSRTLTFANREETFMIVGFNKLCSFYPKVSTRGGSNAKWAMVGCTGGITLSMSL
jgi:hypothetical protein